MFKTIHSGSDFKTLIFYLVLFGLIVLSAFSLGSFFYLYITANLFQKTDVRHFASVLETSTDKDLSLKIQGKISVIKSEELKKWLEKYERSYSKKEDLRLSSEKIYNYLKKVAESVNVEPINANIVFNDGKASVFRPPVEGKKLDLEKSSSIIITTIRAGGGEAELTTTKIPPAITLEKINDLGIKTLISQGESDFSGSSPSRIHNVRLGASKYNGLVIKPGEEFSFNEILGEVDKNSGYMAELVIKNGGLIREYGGGLCQVSTTLFRAAINAGLKITERRPHSFPVKYYNPQGFDATIYPGIVDLKFTNNTPAHILLQTKISGTKLMFEIYGSDDGRTVNLDGPYTYDEKTNGSLKAYFVRKITSVDGIAKEERFNSNYNPPVPLARNPLE
ncbi:MAG: hypothetical protein COV30_00165 [Candidatus Yanofskybacteria bacterium CG10_big_fil_rev_8_21_14_0_10_37_15]|uniref:YoaR-like putative peptidoglycan binding domain-containing protein n=1 Tax=Candidatus Yanofskybacteria bacterium CG10_big_fil_rev_8_21_14_0_10_37_15 TaxID=1975097 RepID=A0A2H0R7W1_9BACT|nr:MAG: hypothetical protein COV30_00165 [Candidatus Yanofskybacteria bacterium CG10_big_fil_rev_8_21_14_0_10_37_15]